MEHKEGDERDRAESHERAQPKRGHLADSEGKSNARQWARWSRVRCTRFLGKRVESESDASAAAGKRVGRNEWTGMAGAVSTRGNTPAGLARKRHAANASCERADA